MREQAIEILKRHWEKSVGIPFDETIKHHLSYAIDAVEEALKLRPESDNKESIELKYVVQKFRLLSDIPNQEGFRFIGLDHDDNLIPCIVRKDNSGCHSAYDERDGSPCFMRLELWSEYNAKDNQQAKRESTKKQSFASSTCPILDWASENLSSLHIKKPYMAMDDDVPIWEAVEWTGRKSYGVTIHKAILDAQMCDDDPNRWTYIPPEYR